VWHQWRIVNVVAHISSPIDSSQSITSSREVPVGNIGQMH
jgi:hypothetical protein